MDKDRFWEIIGRTTAAATQAEQRELFRWELEQLSVSELDAFGNIFGDVLIASYNWDLWLVAWISLRGWCSDDGFHYLRLWLISRGRDVCEAALRDPEAVAELLSETESPSFETFAYVLGDACRQRGEHFSPGPSHPKEPSGGGDWLRPELKDRRGKPLSNLCIVFNELTDADFAVIQKRFPRLWEMGLRKGIIKTEKQKEESSGGLEKLKQAAATVDPNLAKTDFAAYLKALADAARDAYKKKE